MTAAVGRSFAASAVVKAGALGSAPWREHLRSCVIDENVGLPDTATLTYDDNTHELLARTGVTIGGTLEVAVVAARTTVEETLFRGEVTALEMDVDGTGAYTVIRAMSKAHRLHRGRRVKAFRKMTANAIVREVAKNAGLTVGKVETASITYQQLSQAGVSDWEFLQFLAREHGAVVTVDDQGRLDFTKLRPAASAPPPTDSTSPFVLEFGRNMMALRAALSSAELAGGVEVRGWDANAKQKVVARRDTTASTTVLPGLKADGKFPTRTRTLVVDTPYGTQAEANAAADALAASIGAGSGELEAVVDGHPKLRAGVPLTLANAGTAFTGKYTATAVTHVLEPDAGYRTTVVVSASYDRSFAGLTAQSREIRMPGLATGIVTDIKEVGGQRGFVRLKFPWLDDDYVTDWVRTVQLGGGGVFSPEVNDEVLVGFEQGSIDRPYVLGKLYNGVDKPADHRTALVDGRGGTVNRRSLVSREGNRLELLDGAQSGVRLASGDKKLEVLLDEKKGSLQLNVLGLGGRGVTSSITLDSTGITLDAKTGEVRVKGRMIRLN
ncbi:VgrG-related protein [Actinophytocola sp.]|uniref:VgrG-related protein n=1 Tax=Actinophytocola sp. TaxID=1872138 RepID=UPI002D4E3CEA|nr:VgrG-related protein [Actinophytocola sp.]HYQ68023.1 VgrG-related protein [Actinophytocola sp.]